MEEVLLHAESIRSVPLHQGQISGEDILSLSLCVQVMYMHACTENSQNLGNVTCTYVHTYMHVSTCTYMYVCRCVLYNVYTVYSVVMGHTLYYITWDVCT